MPALFYNLLANKSPFFVFLFAGFQPVAVFAADIDALDRQKQFQLAPKCQPSIGLKKEAEQPVDGQSLRLLFTLLPIESSTFSEQELLASYTSLYDTFRQARVLNGRC